MGEGMETGSEMVAEDMKAMELFKNYQTIQIEQSFWLLG
jgi:hypothetical protein